MYDIRFKENFKIMVVGPSRCGKSTFICNMIQNLNRITKSNPTKIIYIYKVWQPLFESMKYEGLVDLFLKKGLKVF